MVTINTKKEESQNIEKHKIENSEAKGKVKGSERNYYIDILKGIAIISVIFIHTAFHSGASYVPDWFANFTLLFEVPMFIFLAGWSYSYSKSNKSYIQGLIITQIKYMIFMTIIFIVIAISNSIGYSNNPIGLSNLINWFFHMYTPTNPIASVKYSLWFFRMYFFIAIIGAMLITIIKPKVLKGLIGTCFIGAFIITFFANKIGNINLGISLSYILFYLFFYCLGYYMRDKKIDIVKFITSMVLIVLTLIGISKLSNINVMDIQGNKFPPNFVYMLWSLFGVIIAIYLKNFFNNCKNDTLIKIGQNSMYIFFAQGVGASILYYISKYITLNWYYKIWIMFGINILITTVVTLILKLILDPVGKKCKQLLKEKICN